MTTTLATPSAGPAVTRLDVGAYSVATDAPQSDGTIVGTRRRSSPWPCSGVCLVLNITSINVWSRLNVTTRQVAGQEW